MNLPAGGHKNPCCPEPFPPLGDISLLSNWAELFKNLVMNHLYF